jgi:hypothetical protein
MLERSRVHAFAVLRATLALSHRAEIDRKRRRVAICFQFYVLHTSAALVWMYAQPHAVKT